MLMGGLGTGGYQCLWEDWALVGISAYGRTGHWWVSVLMGGLGTGGY